MAACALKNGVGWSKIGFKISGGKKSPKFRGKIRGFGAEVACAKTPNLTPKFSTRRLLAPPSRDFHQNQPVWGGYPPLPPRRRFFHFFHFFEGGASPLRGVMKILRKPEISKKSPPPGGVDKNLSLETFLNILKLFRCPQFFLGTSKKFFPPSRGTVEIKPLLTIGLKKMENF
jgi:hypothetical protein